MKLFFDENVSSRLPRMLAVWLAVGNPGTEAIEELLRRERERVERFAASEESSLLILSLEARAV